MTLRLRRRRLAPEVIQSSAMDCGPASLKCLLEGFGISVPYGRLVEACQVEVDGTSIDSLEEISRSLGLHVEQVMVPVDHVGLPSAKAIPAIAVTVLPNGNTHFVVIFSKHGRLVQVMDPGHGRFLASWREFASRLFVHRHAVAARAWSDWARGVEFLLPLRARIRDLGVRDEQIEALVASACEGDSWRALATLDAAVRLVASLVEDRAVRRGSEAATSLATLVEAEGEKRGGTLIPAAFWSVSLKSGADDGDEELWLQGAVLLRVAEPQPQSTSSPGFEPRSQPLPGLPAPATIPRSSAIIEVVGMTLASAPWLLLGLISALAAVGTAFEAILFRAMVDLGRMFTGTDQRLLAVLLVVAFLGAMLGLEIVLALALARSGRAIEGTLRMAVLKKLPCLGDRYFRSRLGSDMAERAHNLHESRALPEVIGAATKAIVQALATVVGIVILDGELAIQAVAIGICTIGAPFAVRPIVRERDFRFRSHAGNLVRFYFDAMVGLVPLRAHGGERPFRTEQETLLTTWVAAGSSLLRISLSTDFLQSMLSYGLIAWLMVDHIHRQGVSGASLLLAYWALSLPLLGQELASVSRLYERIDSAARRILELLHSQEENIGGTNSAAATERVQEETSDRGASVDMQEIEVIASGRQILHGITLRVDSGEHVAIVGESGAGKSSLVGLLLGWNAPSGGELLVDGAPLTEATLSRLRGHAAWVDPGVWIWNRSLLENVLYGAESPALSPIGDSVRRAGLGSVVERLDQGLESTVGEGGRLLSGGEGQRLRLARALARGQARLVILDEAFRGLERDLRFALLESARKQWQGATVLAVTHDIEAALTFDRVVVLDGGTVVEDGRPRDLANAQNSRFRTMLTAERLLLERGWGAADWRRLDVSLGTVTESRASGSAR